MSSRSGKGKLPLSHHGGELFALGSKSSSSTEPKSVKPSSAERKRDSSSSSSSSMQAVKKAKLTSPLPSSSSSRPDRGPSATMEYWEQQVIECEPAELVSSVLTATDQQDSDTIIGLICGAIKSYITARSKPDSMLTLQLFYLAKLRPHIFCNETVTQALVSVLKRDTQNAFKAKNNPSSHVITCNLLARGYYDKKQWPETFLKIYIEDATNERVWVDNEDCAIFVENILSCFGTKMPPKSMLQPELSALPPNKDLAGDEESMDSLPSHASSRSNEQSGETVLQSRFAPIAAKVEKLVLDAVKEQLNRRQGPEGTTRNFLKFLSTVTGIQEVRSLIVSRLELWIHNGKLMKPAQELLTYLCFNIAADNPKDQEVIANLVRIRLKTKPLINIFMQCFKEMIQLQPELLGTLIKHVVQNELSNSRNPNNMGMLANMFQTKPDESSTHLAEIYQEFLLQKEDCLRTLKVFLRELAKALRYDVNMAVFVKAFVNIRPEIATMMTNSEYRERTFNSMIELVCLCMFLCVSPTIRDLIMSMRNGRDVKESPALYNYFAQMCQMQSEVLTFMLDVAPTVFKPAPNEYASQLHKVLLFDPPESYSKTESWPQDAERTFLLRAASEIPLHQDSILKLIFIGINKDIHFSVPDTMEVIDQMVRRAGCLKTGTNYPPLEANKLEIIDLLFNMSEYHHPDNIALPPLYEPPKLAISSLYWKTWTILLILSAHNTSTFGSFCWEQYPMLRNLIEMCITNQFMQSKVSEEEIQLITIEKQQILEFETHLAAATSKMIITEQTSLLLSQVMLMDPLGVPRRPPNHVLEQLQNLNKTHKLGHLLCRSRKPDLLVDIIQRQGTSSMPWLADLVQNSEGDFNHLPVQCLCEFLLSNPVSGTTPREQELMIYLHNLLLTEHAEHQASIEVIEYFLRRLSSTLRTSRQAAIRAIKQIFKVLEKEGESGLLDCNDSEWLLRYLPQIPHFPYVRPHVIIQLRSACQVENMNELIMTYIQFIAAHTLNDGLPEMFETVLDMSQLIVERSTVFSQIIPAANEINEVKYQTLNCLFVMFNNFLVKLRENNKSQIPEYTDLLLIHFADGTQCNIHLSIVQAFVILLTHSASVIPGAETILDYWFPLNTPPPQAYNIETSEPVQILPDWLKLKMIRSNVDRLVDAALQELTPDQIVLFVQNFGTSVNSMSKLLALLDRAVIEQCETVNAAILNKPYLAQLIEIQQARGAKNGHISMQALDLHEAVTQEPPKSAATKVDDWVVNLKQGTQVSKEHQDKPSGKSSKEIEEVVEAILTNRVNNKVMQSKFRHFIQQLSAHGKLPTKSNTSDLFGKVLQYFYKLIKAQQSVYIFRGLVQNAITCSFFRTLFSIKTEKSEHLLIESQLIDELLKNGVNSSQHPILLQIVLNKRKTLGRPKIEPPRQAFAQVLTTSKLSRMEQDGRKLLADVNQDASNMIQSLSIGLRATEAKFEDDHSRAQHLERQGLLVDWLAEADSEMIRSNQNLQLDLLFGRSQHSFRPYLLSLLSHQSSWTTLAKVVQKLLSNYNESYNPACILDFVDALIRNPKLWQGRDRGVPKHEQVEYILQLSQEQVESMVQYILMENLERSKLNLDSRIHLMLNCSDPTRLNLIKLIQFIDQNRYATDDDQSDRAIRRKFLQHLYLNIPPIKFLPVQPKGVYDSNLRPLSGCAADKLTHFMITGINSLTNPKDWQLMSQDFELIVRKLAACHPAIMLREISVLAGLLQGKAHMDLSVLRFEHHLALFYMVLGLIELMQPMIFNDCYHDGLHAALDCFFTFLRHHSNSKESPGILHRLIDLLQAYTTASPNKALVYIESYADLLHDLAAANRNNYNLHQLIQGLSLLKHKHTTLAATALKSEESVSDDQKPVLGDNHSAAAVILAPYSKNDNSPPHWNKLVSAFKRNAVDDINQTLDEIESVTYKKTNLLEDVYDKILNSSFHNSSYIRTKAHNLTVRYLKHNPSNNSNNLTIVTNYIQCLNNDDTAIVLSALDVLTEMVLCLQEHAPQILKTVFNLGVTSQVSTYGHLRKCLLTLKSQHAC